MLVRRRPPRLEGRGRCPGSARPRRERAASPSRSTPPRRGLTTTGTRTHVALTGRSGSSRIFRVSSRSFTSSSYSTPSKSQSIRSRWSSGASARRSSIAAAPAPDTDWYVATRTHRKPAAVAERREHHRERDRAAVGVRDDAVVLQGSLPVHLRDDQRDARLQTEGGRLVDAHCAAAAAAGTSSRLNWVPTENRQTSRSPAPSASGVASSTSSRTERACPQSATTRTRGCSRTRGRRGTASVTRPTAPGRSERVGSRFLDLERTDRGARRA